MLNRCDAGPKKEEIFSRLRELRKNKLDLDNAIWSLDEVKGVWLNHPDEDTKREDLEVLNKMKKHSRELGKAIDQLSSILRLKG